MAELARLYELTGNPGYRRAVGFFFNAVVDQRSCASGANMYVVCTDLGHFRVYGTEVDSFLCCTGTGTENLARWTVQIQRVGKGLPRHL